MSKVLVIVLSETRASELTFDSFKKNVIDELNADLCICIGVKPDYDYNNPFYNLAKYKFLYNEPDDFGDAFEYAFNIISKDRPKYECLENINALYGKIQYSKQTTENINYYGDQPINDFDKFDDDEIVVHTNNFPDNLWKNQVYGIKSSDSNNLINQQDVITYKQPLYWREFLKIVFHGWGVKGAITEHPASSGILLFFRWFLLKNLIDNDLINKYDRFVITRSDYMYQLPHPKVELMNENRIWIPDCEYYGGYTDRHVVLSKNNIESYLNIFNNMVIRSNEYFMKMKYIAELNLEKLIKFHLEQNNVIHLVKGFPYVMYSVRNINGTTRWSQGHFSNQLGYFVKYPSEYEKSSYYKSEFEKSGLTIDEFYKDLYTSEFNDYDLKIINNSFKYKIINTKKIIWSYWHDNNIPDVVKLSILSWNKYNDDYEICFVTNSNLNKYISLPFDISHLYIAHQSDVIRLELLEKYGGVWIDSTIILNCSLNIFIKNNSDLTGFYLKKWTVNINKPVFENWFIACSNTSFITEWKNEYYLSLCDRKKYIMNLENEIDLQKIEMREYLAMHCSFLKIINNKEYKFDLYEAEKYAYKYLDMNDFDSPKSMNYLCENINHEIPPIIKLRSCERRLFDINNIKYNSIFYRILKNIQKRDYLFVILSCLKNQSLWPNILKLSKNIIIFVGNENQKEDYLMKDNIIYLECPDNYESLSVKMISLIHAILNIDYFSDITHIIKIDDHDVIDSKWLTCDINKIIYGEYFDYGGYLIRNQTFCNREWHFGKCSNGSSWNNTIYSGEVVPFIDGGSGYILSRRSMQIINQQYNNLDQVINKYIYEDILMSLLLSKQNIYPTLININSK